MYQIIYIHGGVSRVATVSAYPPWTHSLVVKANHHETHGRGFESD